MRVITQCIILCLNTILFFVFLEFFQLFILFMASRIGIIRQTSGAVDARRFTRQLYILGSALGRMTTPSVIFTHIGKRSVDRSLEGVYTVNDRAMSLVRNDHTYRDGQRYHGNRGHINAKMCTHTIIYYIHLYCRVCEYTYHSIVYNVMLVYVGTVQARVLIVPSPKQPLYSLPVRN